MSISTFEHKQAIGDFGSSTSLSLRRAAQPAGTRGFANVPPIVHEVLSSAGRPLDQATRSFVEPRFDSGTRTSSALQMNSNELKVGATDDHYEHEADSVANRVVHGAENVSPNRQGFDFSQVRIHADERAAESARAVDARAYTVGRDVVFGAGQFRPETTEGRHLLAHELAHVVQQGSSSNVRMQRAPDPEKTKVTLTTRGTCRDERAIAEAIPGALSMTDTAFNWFLSFSTFDRHRIDRLLRAHFLSDSDDVRDRVKDRILRIKDNLLKAQAGNITFVCAPANDPECQGRDGYVMSNERDTVHICDPFFNLTLEGRRWMLIHEHAHLAGAVSSEIYLTIFGPVDEQHCLDPTPLASTADALGNADSYAKFIWCLVRKAGIEVNPPAP